MDVAAMSMNMASYKLEMSVGISMAKKAMNSQAESAEYLFDALDQTISKPPSEHLIDIKV